MFIGILAIALSPSLEKAALCRSGLLVGPLCGRFGRAGAERVPGGPAWWPAGVQQLHGEATVCGEARLIPLAPRVGARASLGDVSGNVLRSSEAGRSAWSEPTHPVGSRGPEPPRSRPPSRRARCRPAASARSLSLWFARRSVAPGATAPHPGVCLSVSLGGPGSVSRAAAPGLPRPLLCRRG